MSFAERLLATHLEAVSFTEPLLAAQLDGASFDGRLLTTRFDGPSFDERLLTRSISRGGFAAPWNAIISVRWSTSTCLPYLSGV